MRLRYIICFFGGAAIFTLVFCISYALQNRQTYPGVDPEQKLQAGLIRETLSVRAAERNATINEGQSESVMPVQEAPVGADVEFAFFVTAKDGLITVYESDGQTVYLHTSIEINWLETEEQHRLLEGFYVPTELELFDYLENCTS